MSSGIVTISLYPLTAATIARPMPVLPLVGSMIVAPGFRRPSLSAVSIMLSAMRSLTLPAGLSDSTLATISAQSGWTSRFRRTMGVPPTRSSTLSAILLLFLICLLNVVPRAADLRRALALREVRYRCILQDAEDRFTHRRPHVALGAAAVLVALAGLIKAIDKHYRAFQRLD